MKGRYILLIISLLLGAVEVMAESGVPELERGASVFQYQCEGYFEGINLDVYYYIPQQGLLLGKGVKGLYRFHL